MPDPPRLHLHTTASASRLCPTPVCRRRASPPVDVQAAVQRDPTCISAERLSTITGVQCMMCMCYLFKGTWNLVRKKLPEISYFLRGRGLPLSASYRFRQVGYCYASRMVRSAILGRTQLPNGCTCLSTGAQVRDELFGWPRDLPQQEERARLLREVSKRVRKRGRWVTPGGVEV